MYKEGSVKTQMVRFTQWLKHVGEFGAHEDVFRPEGICWALPKKSIKIDIRLYCHFVNPHVVILFNGGIKTALKNKDCPNVRPHFNNATSWTKQLLSWKLACKGHSIIDYKEILIKY